MSKTISAHCNITNPKTAGYPYVESIKSFANLCDEVVVVDGGTTDGSLEPLKRIDRVRIVKGRKWKRDFDWTIIGRNTNIGYLECNSDWAFHFDVDYIFHEDYVETLRKEVEKSDLPAIELKKVNFVLHNACFEKDHYPLLVNKKRYPVIRYGIGEDNKKNKSGSFLRPIVKSYIDDDGMDRGEIVKMSNMRLTRSNVKFYTYDFTFMTKKQIRENRLRFSNALDRFFGREGNRKGDDCFNDFLKMMIEREKRCKYFSLNKHSKFIIDKVKNITPEQFGFNGFGKL